MMEYKNHGDSYFFRVMYIYSKPHGLLSCKVPVSLFHAFVRFFMVILCLETTKTIEVAQHLKKTAKNRWQRLILRYHAQRNLVRLVRTSHSCAAAKFGTV